MLSKLTLIGLHEYSEGAIWDDLELPEGIDKDILVNEILRQNGEFCTIYPDEDFLKLQIQIWSKKWKPNFTKWVDVLNKEYEALWNVDVHDSFREEGTNEENSAKEGSASGVAGSIAGSISRGNKDSKESGNTYEHNNGTNSGSTNSAGSGNGISIGNNQNDKYKAAYDASTVQQTEKEVVSTSLSNSEHNSASTSEYGSNSSSSSGSHSGSYSEITSLSTSESTSESSSSDNSESMTANSEHTIKTENWKRGNHGITMSQELLLAELNVRRFNLYSQIADIFASEFCVCVYF